MCFKRLLHVTSLTLNTHKLRHNKNKIGKECASSDSLYMTVVTFNTPELSDNNKISGDIVFLASLLRLTLDTEKRLIIQNNKNMMQNQ